MRHLSFIAILLTTISVGCAAPETPEAPERAGGTEAATLPPPSAEQAEEIITSAPEWSDYKFSNAAWSLPLDQPIDHPVTLEMAKDLERADWIRVDRTNRVVLTQRAMKDRRFLVRPNDVVEMVPLAKKEFGEVTAIEPAGENVEVHFTWQWVPNEVGASFQSGFLHERYSATHQATATLMPREGEWMLLIIEEAKEGESEE